MRMKLATIAAAAALATISPITSAPAAQGRAADTSYGEPAREDDDRFPWGLLGLLGLLGLIPRKKKEIVVDNRNNRT